MEHRETGKSHDRRQNASIVKPQADLSTYPSGKYVRITRATPPGGYQFFVLVHPTTPVREAYDKLIQKIETGLAHRYLRSSDFPGDGASQNRLYIDGTAVNGRISESDEGPTVVVDGHDYSWEEFGSFLSPFTGFNFRLECFDACEEPETTPDPPRPDPVWWLEKEEGPEGEDQHHH
jgi:hypothetical protein